MTRAAALNDEPWGFPMAVLSRSVGQNLSFLRDLWSDNTATFILHAVVYAADSAHLNPLSVDDFEDRVKDSGFGLRTVNVYEVQSLFVP